MQIKFHSTGETVHISKEGAAPLIASGFAEEVKPNQMPPVRFTPKTEWAVLRITGNGEPYIKAHCHSPNCNREHVIRPNTGFETRVKLSPAYKTSKFWHCGVGEEVPAEIQQQFRAAWLDYMAGNKVDTGN